MHTCMTRDEALVRLLDFDMSRAQKKDLLDIIDGRMHHVLFHHKGGKPFPLSWIKVDPDNGVFIGYDYDHPVNYDVEKFGDDKWKVKVNVCSVYHLPPEFNVVHVLENIKNTAFKIIGDITYDNTYWYYAISSCYTKNEDGFVFVSMYINPVTGESNYVHICEYYPETQDLVFTNDPKQYGNKPDAEPVPEDKPITGFLITCHDDGSATVQDSNGNSWNVKDHTNSTIYEMFHVYDDGRLETANPLINISEVRFETNVVYDGINNYTYIKGATINDTYITAIANDYKFEYWRDGKLKLTINKSNNKLIIRFTKNNGYTNSIDGLEHYNDYTFSVGGSSNNDVDANIYNISDYNLTDEESIKNFFLNNITLYIDNKLYNITGIKYTPNNNYYCAVTDYNASGSLYLITIPVDNTGNLQLMNKYYNYG